MKNTNKKIATKGLVFGLFFSLFFVSFSVYSSWSKPGIDLPSNVLSVPVDIKTTNNTLWGDFVGYKAMNDWIQENGCAGYHVCDYVETLRYVRENNTRNLTATNAWMNVGPYSHRIMDCQAWRSTNSGHFGGIWTAGASGTISYASCNTVLPVLCCKY